MERQKALIATSLVLALAVSTGLLLDQAGNEKTAKETPDWKSKVSGKPEVATFAGGCFWCIEAIYDGKKGVKSAVSGYTGGKASTATYRMVASGKTEHREAVRVKYYPSVISYKKLLEMYWRSIDPTDAGGQFADRGYQYTTAIYAHSHKQYRLARESKQNLSQSGKFEEEIVTEVLNASEFYRAEDKHQNYSRKNTIQYKAYERASGRKGFVERVWEKSPIG